MAHEGYHEPVEKLSAETQDFHRAVISLIEELEAVDWYNQRAEACTDAALKAILAHNRDEEIEHASMTLEWIPETTLNTVERCAGHDGTYGVKREFYANSMKIGTPVFNRMAEPGPDYVTSDCPIAARRIMHGIDQSGTGARPRKEHPLTLLRIAYGL